MQCAGWSKCLIRAIINKALVWKGTAIHRYDLHYPPNESFGGGGLWVFNRKYTAPRASR